jgi:hypothetical protein
MFAQNPRVNRVMVGKRTNVFTQTVEIYPTVIAEGYIYHFQHVDASAVVTDINYTVPAAASVASICTALAALIAPLNDSVPTANSTNVSIVATAGKLFDLRELPNPDHLKVKDVTADPGIAADLSAVEAIDSRSWYGILLDYGGKATTVAAAAWVEARRKLFGYDTSDQECADNVITTDVMSTLKTSAYARVYGEFCQRQLLSYAAAAWVGKLGFRHACGRSCLRAHRRTGCEYPGQERQRLHPVVRSELYSIRQDRIGGVDRYHARLRLATERPCDPLLRSDEGGERFRKEDRDVRQRS